MNSKSRVTGEEMMTTGFEFEWLKILQAAEQEDMSNDPHASVDQSDDGDAHTMSEAAAIFNDLDRYEEGMYPLPYTDWHPAPQSVDPDPPQTQEPDPYDGYDDPPPKPGDLENFVNDVGEFISDPISKIWRGLFG